MGGWGGTPPEERPVPKAIRSVYEGTPNAIGIYDMDGNCTELAIAGATTDTPAIIRRGNSVLQTGKTGISKRSRETRDVLKVPGTGFRIVLAPTPDDFFTKQLAMPPVEVRTASVNERRYATFCTYYAVPKQDAVWRLAAALGAQLFEPASVDELSQVLKALNPIKGFPAFLGFHYENGKLLRFSDGTPLESPELPTPRNSEFSTLCAWNGKYEDYKPNFPVPTLLFEWVSEDAWQHRADGVRNGTAPGIKAQFTIQGRTFTLLRCTLPGYGAEAYCSIFGARPAVLADETLRAQVISRINDLKLDCPVTIGATQKGEKWFWLDNTPLFNTPKDPPIDPIKGHFTITHKHVIPALVIFNGKLMCSRETEMMLVEFP